MAERISVLLVDDHPENLLALESILGDMGLNLVKVESGREALRHCLSQDFALILLDVHMPDVDGFETARLVRERERSRHTPIIFLTASPFGKSEEGVFRGYSVGAVDYILKPFVPEILKAKVAVFVDLFAKTEEVRRQAEELAIANQQLGAQLEEIEQLNRELEASKNQRLAALRRVDLAITSALDLRVTLDVLLEQVITELSVHAAAVLLLDAHIHRLEYAAGRGFRTTALQHTRLLLGEGHAGRAALERRIVSIPDLLKDAGDLTRATLLASEDFIGYYAVPLVAKGQVKGVLETFSRQAFEPGQEWLDFLETLAGQAAIAIDNAALFSDLQRSNLELALAYDATLEGWSRALDLRDRETEGHCQRVAEAAVRLARDAGMSEGELVHVRRGALLHDIGKMGIPDGILLKPGPLTEEEWAIMRKHPVYAYEMLSPIAFLHPTLDIPYCHHEKWDGTGYPRGLKGEQMPLAARVFAVVDVWEALRSDRPYRAAWPEDKVREHIVAEAGKHFDPKMVEVFYRNS